MTAARALRPPPCELRAGKLDDLAFVVDCWTKNDPELRKMRIGESTRHVRALLAREASRLVIAHVPGDPDSILGWTALETEPTCVHYVYVRRDARRLGIAAEMLGAVTVVEYSHAAPARWPPENGAIGVPMVVPSGWVLNVKRARTI